MKLLNGRTVKELFFSSEGRVSYWEEMFYSAVLGAIDLVVILLLLFIENKLIGIIEVNPSSLMVLLMWIIYLVILGIDVLYIIMNIFLDIKRFHDLGREGSRLWCLLIPIYNIWVWIEMMFLPGQEGENKYGKEVNDVTTLVKVIAIVGTVLVICYDISTILSKF